MSDNTNNNQNDVEEEDQKEEIPNEEEKYQDQGEEEDDKAELDNLYEEEKDNKAEEENDNNEEEMDDQKMKIEDNANEQGDFDNNFEADQKENDLKDDQKLNEEEEDQNEQEMPKEEDQEEEGMPEEQNEVENEPKEDYAKQKEYYKEQYSRKEKEPQKTYEIPSNNNRYEAKENTYKYNYDYSKRNNNLPESNHNMSNSYSNSFTKNISTSNPYSYNYDPKDYLLRRTKEVLYGNPEGVCVSSPILPRKYQTYEGRVNVNRSRASNYTSNNFSRTCNYNPIPLHQRETYSYIREQDNNDFMPSYTQKLQTSNIKRNTFEMGSNPIGNNSSSKLRTFNFTRTPKKMNINIPNLDDLEFKRKEVQTPKSPVVGELNDLAKSPKYTYRTDSKDICKACDCHCNLTNCCMCYSSFNN